MFSFMTRQRLSTLRLAVGIVAVSCVLTTVTAIAKADVAFGNLGNSGTGSLNATTTDIIQSATSAGQVSGLAQGFKTGTSSDFLTLESVVLGLFSEVGSRTVSLYSSVSGVPGTLLATSSPVSVTAQNSYTFNFPSVSLTADTPYWVVPDADVSWYFALLGAFDTPSGKNGSGYTYVGTAQKTFESGNAWVGGAAPGYSISVNAVPEPATYAMAAVGFAAAGLVRLRRRMVRSGR